MEDPIGFIIFYGLLVFETAFWTWAVVRLSAPEGGHLIALRLALMILLGAAARFLFYFVMMLRSLGTV